MPGRPAHRLHQAHESPAEVGELEAGFVASLFASATLGVTVSVVSGGVVTLLAAAAVAAVAPIVRDYRGFAASR